MFSPPQLPQVSIIAVSALAKAQEGSHANIFLDPYVRVPQDPRGTPEPGYVGPGLTPPSGRLKREACSREQVPRHPVNGDLFPAPLTAHRFPAQPPGPREVRVVCGLTFLWEPPTIFSCSPLTSSFLLSYIPRPLSLRSTAPRREAGSRTGPFLRRKQPPKRRRQELQQLTGSKPEGFFSSPRTFFFPIDLPLGIPIIHSKFSSQA